MFWGVYIFLHARLKQYAQLLSNLVLIGFPCFIILFSAVCTSPLERPKSSTLISLALMPESIDKGSLPHEFIVTLSKFLNLSEFYFFICEKG